MNKYMLNIAVCDDENAVMQIVSDSVLGAFKSRDIKVNMSEFTDAKVLYTSFKNGAVYDLVFLDIEMPRIDGVDFAAKIIKENFVTGEQIVFVTGMEERVFDTFKVRPFGFVRKNRFLNDLSGLIDRYMRFHESHREKQPPLIVSAFGHMYSIDIHNIKYIECIQRNQKIFFNDDREPLTISSTMAELEAAVTGGGEEGFYRVHKGYIINLRCVSFISAEGVILDDKTCIPINRKKLQQFKQVFINFQQSNGARLIGGG